MKASLQHYSAINSQDLVGRRLFFVRKGWHEKRFSKLPLVFNLQSFFTQRSYHGI